MSENGKGRDAGAAMDQVEVAQDFKRMTSKKIDKSVTCQQCSEPAKYTCPACLWRTCSVTCIKLHKEETRCSGIRDKVKYKPMSQMDDLDILNDYRLLEEIGRQVEAAGRAAPRGGRPGVPPPLRPAQHRLRRAAKKRGVRLDFLPAEFERRRCNTTELQPGAGGGDARLLWRLEWRLPLADTLIADAKVPETQKLSEALGRHLAVAAAPDDAKEDRLQFYRAAFETGSVRVFLQLERVQQGDRYLEVPLHRSLAECLKQQLVIEFPVMVVTTEQHAAPYRTDTIEVSFFSLCKQEEEQQRRVRRAERRRAPSDTALQPQPARDEPGRKLPRPRLDSVPVAAAAPAPQQQPARGQEEEEGDTAVQLPAPAVPRPERQLAAAGFGLFGAADDEELSD